MNWLDTQTKELLQRAGNEKLAPPKTAEFALVLIRKGNDYERLRQAVIKINKCSEPNAMRLVRGRPPIVINSDLTEEEALLGQFELICCDSISLFLRTDVLELNDKTYLEGLFHKILGSDEFKPCTIRIVDVPQTEAGEKFMLQFLIRSESYPATFTVLFKKARIMEHWAKRVGARVEFVQ